MQKLPSLRATNPVGVDVKKPRVVDLPTSKAQRTTPATRSAHLLSKRSQTAQKAQDLVVKNDRKQLATSPDESRWRLLLSTASDSLDPFASIPAPALTKGQEHLIKFYLLQYPQVTYGFSPQLKPHPVATNFSIALDYPACFQVILARSALYRLSLRRYANEKEKQGLELATLHHKQKAIHTVRKLSLSSPQSQHNDQLIASIISIGTFDRRSGSTASSDVHFAAVRRLLRTAGGPTNIRDAALSRVVLFFECIYGTSGSSYVWESEDLTNLLVQLNLQLDQISRAWESPANQAIDESRNASGEHVKYPRRWLTTGTDLHRLLSKSTFDTAPAPSQQKVEVIFQLTCLLSLALAVVHYMNDPELLKSYEKQLQERVEKLQMTEKDSCSNILWVIQINDFADKHKFLMWGAAASVWVCKYLSFDVQVNIRDHLMLFLTGEPPAKVLQLSSFHFSYNTRGVDTTLS